MCHVFFVGKRHTLTPPTMFVTVCRVAQVHVKLWRTRSAQLDKNSYTWEKTDAKPCPYARHNTCISGTTISFL